jgi:hypothetical protein
MSNDADRALADSFDHPSDDDNSDNEGEEGDARQRLMRTHTGDGLSASAENATAVTQHPAQPPTFEPSSTATSVLASTVPDLNRSTNDGVFANLNAKPEVGEKVEEHPPVRFTLSTQLAASLLTRNRLMNKPQQMQPLHIGNLQFWYLVPVLQMKSMSMGYPSVLYSLSYGTA